MGAHGDLAWLTAWQSVTLSRTGTEAGSLRCRATFKCGRSFFLRRHAALVPVHGHARAQGRRGDEGRFS